MDIKEKIKSNPKLTAVIAVLLLFLLMSGSSDDDLQTENETEITLNGLNELRPERDYFDNTKPEFAGPYKQAIDLFIAGYFASSQDIPALFATISMPPKIEFDANKPGVLAKKAVIKNFKSSGASIGDVHGMVWLDTPAAYNGDKGSYQVKLSAASEYVPGPEGPNAFSGDYYDYLYVSFDEIEWKIPSGVRHGGINGGRLQEKGQIELEVVPDGIELRYVVDGKVEKSEVSKKHQPAIYLRCSDCVAGADIDFYR